MTQYALPVSDGTVASWVEGAGDGDANHFDELDEGFGAGRGTGIGPDDIVTYWESVSETINVIESDLSAVIDPVGNVGHIYRSRSRKNLALGRRVDIILILMEGPVVRANLTFIDPDNVWTTRAVPLSAGESDAIGSYADLLIQTIALQVGGGARRHIQESAHEFECPDPPAVPDIGWLLQASDVFSALPAAVLGIVSRVDFVPAPSFGWFVQITTIPYFGLPFLSEGEMVLTPVFPLPDPIPPILPSPDLNVPTTTDVIRVPDKVVSY